MHPLRFFVFFICASCGKTDTFIKELLEKTDCEDLRAFCHSTLLKQSTHSSLALSFDSLVIPFLQSISDCGLLDLQSPGYVDVDVEADIANVIKTVLTPYIGDEDKDSAELPPSEEPITQIDSELSSMFAECQLNVPQLDLYPISIRRFIYSLSSLPGSARPACTDIVVMQQLFLTSTEAQASNTKKRGIDESAVVRDALIQLNALSGLWQEKWSKFEIPVRAPHAITLMWVEVLRQSEFRLNESVKNTIFLLYTTRQLEHALASMFQLWVYYSRRLAIMDSFQELEDLKNPLLHLTNSIQIASSVTKKQLSSFTFNAISSPGNIREDRERLMKFYTLIEDTTGLPPDLDKRCRVLAGYTIFAQAVHNEDALQLELYPFLTMSLARAFRICGRSQADSQKQMGTTCATDDDTELTTPQVCPAQMLTLSDESIDYFHAARMFDFMNFNGYSDGVPLELKAGQYFGTSQAHIRPVSIGIYRWTERFTGYRCEETLKFVRAQIDSAPNNVWRVILRDQLKTIPDVDDVSLCLHLSILRLISEINLKCGEDATPEDINSAMSSRHQLKSLRSRYSTHISSIAPISIALQARAWEYWRDRKDLTTLFGNPKVHEKMDLFLKDMLAKIFGHLSDTVEGWNDDDLAGDPKLNTLFREDYKLYDGALYSLSREYFMLVYRSISKMVFFLHSLDYANNYGVSTESAYMEPLAMIDTAEIVDTAGALLAEKLGHSYSCLANFKGDLLKNQLDQQSNQDTSDPISEQKSGEAESEPESYGQVSEHPSAPVSENNDEVDSMISIDQNETQNFPRSDSQIDLTQEIDLQLMDEILAIPMHPVLRAEVIWESETRKVYLHHSHGMSITSTADKLNLKVCVMERLINKPNICITIDDQLMQLVSE